MDPFLYRSMELNDDNDEKRALTRQYIDRLLDPSSDLSQHVRDLRISHFTGRSWRSGAFELEQILDRLSQLLCFRYVNQLQRPSLVMCWHHATSDWIDGVLTNE